MTLKEKMKKGPVFGMACFTGTTCVIENIAMSGLDFIYLDLEHTNYMLMKHSKSRSWRRSCMIFRAGAHGRRQRGGHP